MTALRYCKGRAHCSGCLPWCQRCRCWLQVFSRVHLLRAAYSVKQLKALHCTAGCSSCSIFKFCLDTAKRLCSRSWHNVQSAPDTSNKQSSSPCVCPQNCPVLYSAVTHSFRGYVHTQNTPNPAPKHLFSLPWLESGQNEVLSGQLEPQQCPTGQYV